MSHSSYMSQLNQKDRNFLLQLAYSDAPQSRVSPAVRKPAESLSSDRENRANDLVDRLKSELVEERSEVFRLRQECETLKEELRSAKEKSDTQVKEQEERIAEISERFKEVMAENLKLKRQITFSLKQYEEHSAEANSATEALTTLRQLLLGMLDKENSRKKKDIAERRMWESLGTLLPECEPPIDFPVLTTDFELLKSSKADVELRKKDDTIRSFRCRIEQLEKENAQLLAQKRDLKRSAGAEGEKVKRQLVGSVRRIEYLVQEKEQLLGEKKQLQEYCTKLEQKLLALTAHTRKPGKSPPCLTEESQAVDLRVDKQKLLDLIDSESSEVSEEVLRRVQEAHLGRSRTDELRHDRTSAASHSDLGTSDKRSKSAVTQRNTRKTTRSKTSDGNFSKDITNIPRLFELAKQRLARFYEVQLVYQQLPSTAPAVFVNAEIVVLSTDMRALFWSAVQPGSPKQRFMMPNVQQAQNEDFQPMYGSAAIEAALKMGYHTISSVIPESYGEVVFLKKPSEILIIRFEDKQTAFRWFQLVIIALGLYHVVPGQSLLDNLSEKKHNFEAYLRDKIKPENTHQYIVNISEKDSGFQEAKYLYKVISIASLREGKLIESEYVLPYGIEVRTRQKMQEWEQMIVTDYQNLDIGGATFFHEFFLSLQYNWTFRLQFAPFPLFSDANSDLQRSETLTRAFICRKKLVQISKRTKEEDLIHTCEKTKKACAEAVPPFEEFINVSEAFRQAMILRTFLIAFSV